MTQWKPINTYLRLISRRMIMYIAVKLFHTIKTKKYWCHFAWIIRNHLLWWKVYLSGKTGVNKSNFQPTHGGRKTLYKKNGLTSRWGLIFYYDCMMDVQLVETVISWEFTSRFPVVKCSLKRYLLNFYFGT